MPRAAAGKEAVLVFVPFWQLVVLVFVPFWQLVAACRPLKEAVAAGADGVTSLNALVVARHKDAQLGHAVSAQN